MSPAGQIGFEDLAAVEIVREFAVPFACVGYSLTTPMILDLRRRRPSSPVTEFFVQLSGAHF